MPRITIELHDEQIAALLAGENISIGSKPKKVSANPPPTPEQIARQKAVIDEWHSADKSTNAGRVWKAIREVPAESTEGLCCAIRLALDWNYGRSYSPEFFVKDYASWAEKSGNGNEWAIEADRTAYRKRMGLK